MNAPESFKNAVKLTVLLQAALEQMDVVKGTKIYKQKVKSQMIALERSIEQLVLEPIRQLDAIDAELFTNIQNNVEMILDMDLAELAQLKEAVEESRNN
jgi:hypothetical protein